MTGRTAEIKFSQQHRLNRETELSGSDLPPDYVRRQNTPWQERAACRGVGAETFFPEPILGRGAKEKMEEIVSSTRSEYCDNCEVQTDCKQYADGVEKIGIWAGKLLTQWGTKD